MLQALLIPVYLAVVIVVFGRSIRPSPKGSIYLLSALGLFVSFGTYFNSGLMAAIHKVWTDPRYLAHSVRELLTFPLVYYPVPLFFMMKDADADPNTEKVPKGRDLTSLKIFLLLCTVIFVAAIGYQSYIPLKQGIGELAQKPAFAKGGKLGIPYLLASHYFEHFLDAVYFSLLCLLLYGAATHRNSALQVRDEY